MLSQRVKKLLLKKRQDLRDNCSCEEGCQKCDWWYDLYYRMALARIPSKFWDYKLGDFTWCDEEKVIRPVRKYITNINKMLEEGVGLYLWGRNSVGKSLVASLILKAALIKNYTVYFTSFETVLNMSSDGMYDRDARYEFRQKILQTDFLVLDDIDKTYRSSSTFSDSKLDLVFRARANDNLPVIITANMSRSQAIERSTTKIDDKETEKIDIYVSSLLELFDEMLVDIIFVASKSKRKEIHKHKLSLLFDKK